MAQSPGEGRTPVRSQGFEVLVQALKEGPGKNRVHRTNMNKLRRLKLGSMREALNRIRGNFA